MSEFTKELGILATSPIFSIHPEREQLMAETKQRRRQDVHFYALMMVLFFVIFGGAYLLAVHYHMPMEGGTHPKFSHGFLIGMPFFFVALFALLILDAIYTKPNYWPIRQSLVAAEWRLGFSPGSIYHMSLESLQAAADRTLMQAARYRGLYCATIEGICLGLHPREGREPGCGWELHAVQDVIEASEGLSKEQSEEFDAIHQELRAVGLGNEDPDYYANAVIAESNTVHPMAVRPINQ